MSSGRFCWMLSSLRCTVMALLLHASMGRGDDSILGCSHIQQTTQRSDFFSPGNIMKLLKPAIDRIILASIKNLGKYPCPRCKVQMEHVSRMGEPEDRLVRVETSRFDDRSRREAVESARDLIFKKNLAVTNNTVENLLSVGSYLPIDVRSLAYHITFLLLTLKYHRTHSLPDLQSMDSMSSQCL